MTMRTGIFFATVFTSLLFAAGIAAEKTPQTAQTTFAVHCYDVGASALGGKPGVLAVERGWSGGREVNRVVYDPREVAITQLESWLKAADTYVRTLEQPTAKEMPR
jgi:hypothetical protein